MGPPSDEGGNSMPDVMRHLGIQRFNGAALR